MAGGPAVKIHPNWAPTKHHMAESVSTAKAALEACEYGDKGGALKELKLLRTRIDALRQYIEKQIPD